MPSTSGPQSISDSDYGVIEFSKEDVEALVNEKLRIKNNFNYKLEGNYVTQLEILKKSMMKAKEDELNTIIMELRKNLEALQEKFTKEEVDKLEVLDSLSREKDSTIAAERFQVSLSEDLKRTQQDNASTNQKATNETPKNVEHEKAAAMENLSKLRGHYTSGQEQLTLSRGGDLQDPSAPTKTLDLPSSLEVGPATSSNGENAAALYSARSILTIAFQFPFESNLQDNVASMACQYVRSVISSVQRVAMAISPSGSGPTVGSKLSPTSPEAVTLAHWICQSYSYRSGAELLGAESTSSKGVLKSLWHHQDVILCCSLKDVPVFTFASLYVCESGWARYARDYSSCFARYQGVGGIMELTPGYLPAVYSAVKKAGGLCIDDELQSGFARTRSHFWGFEAHGVVPDIVNMAKGIGNRIPLGAVVTTPEIAKVLAHRSYFNTFGGNPVCTAAGLAVLNVIEKEKLQENALTVGSYLKQRLVSLKDKFEIIGDVRGRGPMLGVELVKKIVKQ
ncbi:alanine--glyoxylate aminotransferase 2 homolog 3 mitochondrial [Phtheirospermum japonicum]|uniref:Alanine--glyoxylate aminotransferase 2 homolog 3 mitochondrial n=1 Tax=Phtheirospermum japonicum TaxID=374723 RepID=A0A830DF66_9LAMI|nr:alanine--glyoxylate aminotransferase 2 homolog 3 mitochondrial [Phtheirospermum japonicum]